MEVDMCACKEEGGGWDMGLRDLWSQLAGNLTPFARLQEWWLL